MNKKNIAKELLVLAKNLIAGTVEKRFQEYGGSITVSAAFPIAVDNQKPDAVISLIHRGQEEIKSAMEALEKDFIKFKDSNINSPMSNLCSFSFDAHQIKIKAWNEDKFQVIGTSPVNYENNNKDKTEAIILILKKQGFKAA